MPPSWGAAVSSLSAPASGERASPNLRLADTCSSLPCLQLVPFDKTTTNSESQPGANNASNIFSLELTATFAGGRHPLSRYKYKGRGPRCYIDSWIPEDLSLDSSATASTTLKLSHLPPTDHVFAAELASAAEPSSARRNSNHSPVASHGSESRPNRADGHRHQLQAPHPQGHPIL